MRIVDAEDNVVYHACPISCLAVPVCILSAPLLTRSHPSATSCISL